VASSAFIQKHKLTPLARITGGATVGLHPNTMGLGPIAATQKLSKMLKIQPTDFDLIELNEAFAVQALACIKELKLNPDNVNRLGGGISLGHPLGASGTRILTTLAHQMQQDKKIKSGLATMCIGVGQGIAVGLESCV
jgi:acetyl-CoA acetyltransferase